MATITSKGMTLISIATGQPVYMNQVVKPRYDRTSEFTVVGGTAPIYDGASGRVYVKNALGAKSEVAPNIVGLAWRAMQ